MKTLEETKSLIKSNIRWEQFNPVLLGGQSCGMIHSNQILISDDLDVKIEIGHYKSMLKNRELAFILFELVLDEIVK